MPRQSNHLPAFFDPIPLGWFNAYGVAAHNTSADVFVHLGDYVRQCAYRYFTSYADIGLVDLRKSRQRVRFALKMVQIIVIHI